MVSPIVRDIIMANLADKVKLKIYFRKKHHTSLVG